MTRINVVAREVGKFNPEYSLEFDVPEVPTPGTYISIHRPNKPEPYGEEDLIVEKVWWRLEHPETRALLLGDEARKVGSLIKIFVECLQATRVQIRQDALTKK